jgi:hypothetical protein
MIVACLCAYCDDKKCQEKYIEETLETLRFHEIGL